MNEEQPVVQSPRIWENHAGQPCYLVEYDEDQWLKYDKTGQDFCFEQWVKKAKPLGAMFVVLRLFPDALFPSGDKTIPYVVRTAAVDRETFNPIRVSAKLSAEIHADTWAQANEAERHRMKVAARAELNTHALAVHGGSYEIWTRAGGGAPFIIEKGAL